MCLRIKAHGTPQWALRVRDTLSENDWTNYSVMCLHVFVSYTKIKPAVCV